MKAKKVVKLKKKTVQVKGKGKIKGKIKANLKRKDKVKVKIKIKIKGKGKIRIKGKDKGTAKAAKNTVVKTQVPVKRILPDLPIAVITAIKALDARKATDIKVYNVSGMTAMWDYFIICGATSSVHGSSLRDGLKKDMAAVNMPISREDRGRESSWHVVDFGDMLVHIFEAQSRAYYALETMWGEKEVDVTGFLI